MKTLYFSSLLNTYAEPNYKPAAERLFAALNEHKIPYELVDGTLDIWMRDYMPIKTRSGKLISFRYDPSYLEGFESQKTIYKRDLAHRFSFPVEYSNINLDGGNVVFSPSGNRAIISDRVYYENPDEDEDALKQRLGELLEAEVIIIPSLDDDMTGHADGMVRFIDENHVFGNDINDEFEMEIERILQRHEIETTGFPCYDSDEKLCGCYINYLETDNYVIVPAFNQDKDEEATSKAKEIFEPRGKKVLMVKIPEIAAEGGCLNCISWEY